MSIIQFAVFRVAGLRAGDLIAVRLAKGQAMGALKVFIGTDVGVKGRTSHLSLLKTSEPTFCTHNKPFDIATELGSLRFKNHCCSDGRPSFGPDRKPLQQIPDDQLTIVDLGYALKVTIT